MAGPDPPHEQDDLSDWKRDIKRLWTRVLLALNKAAALGVALLIHKGLDWAAHWILPVGWDNALKLYQGVFFVTFSIIYVHLLWEMLATFVPAVRRRNRKAKNADDPKDKQQNLFRSDSGV